MPHLSRRDLLRGAGALATGALLPSALYAEIAADLRQRLDAGWKPVRATL